MMDFSFSGQPGQGARGHPQSGVSPPDVQREGLQNVEDPDTVKGVLDGVAMILKKHPFPDTDTLHPLTDAVMDAMGLREELPEPTSPGLCAASDIPCGDGAKPLVTFCCVA